MNSSLEHLPAVIATKVTRGRKRKRATDPALSDLYPDPGLEDLVRLRVAQIHECKWSMHEQTKKMKARGERTFRLGLLKEWRTQMIFSDRERAALNLAEVITCDSIGGVPDQVVRVACLIFSESEMICLVLTILAINDWHYLSSSLAPGQAAKCASRPKSTFRQTTLKETP
jgi:alkylhydroperoxidase family enzyme